MLPLYHPEKTKDFKQAFGTTLPTLKLGSIYTVQYIYTYLFTYTYILYMYFIYYIYYFDLLISLLHTRGLLY